jgi:hypothetical protein
LILHAIVGYPTMNMITRRKMFCADAPNVGVSKVAKVQRVKRAEDVFSGSVTAAGKS